MTLSKLTIEQYPDKHLVTLFFLPVAKVNIARTVRCSYLSPAEELTHEKAVAIFRDMRWKSNVKAFLLQDRKSVV